jgi:hypothetical protein
VANRKKTNQDFNSDAATVVLELTGSKRSKGEDLIADPKLRKAFKEAKKQDKAKKR